MQISGYASPVEGQDQQDIREVERIEEELDMCRFLCELVTGIFILRVVLSVVTCGCIKPLPVRDVVVSEIDKCRLFLEIITGIFCLRIVLSILTCDTIAFFPRHDLNVRIGIVQ